MEQGDREVDQEVRTKRTENLHTQDKPRERDAMKAKEDVVENVAESMHDLLYVSDSDDRRKRLKTVRQCVEKFQK